MSTAPGRLDVFVRHPTGGVYQVRLDGSEWKLSADGGMRGQLQPAATSSGPDRLDVFCKNLGESYIYHHRWAPATGWESKGGFGNAVSAPAAASWGPDRLDVFARTADNRIQHHWRTGPLQPSGATWGQDVLPGVLPLQDAPAAVSWGPDRIDVFARHADGWLAHAWYSGGWHPWERLEGPSIVGGGPAAASWAEGRLDVFARVPSGKELPRERLGHWWFDGQWHNESFELPNPGIIGSPAAVSWGRDRIDVFATTGGHELVHMWWG